MITLFERNKPAPGDERAGDVQQRHRAAVGRRSRERLRRRCLREARVGLRPGVRSGAAARAACARSSTWALPPASACSRSASAPASTCRSIPRTCALTGIDFSSSMLEKARDRVARMGLRTFRLLQMDAADLKFADDAFDIVYAPYLISVVPDPVKVAREMRRVCRPRRPHHLPEPLPQPEPAGLPRRTADLPIHHPHRVQGRSRPAGVSLASRSAACLDREGERAADLVARDVREGLSPPALAGGGRGCFLRAAVRRPRPHGHGERRGNLLVRRRRDPAHRRLAQPAAQSWRLDVSRKASAEVLDRRRADRGSACSRTTRSACARGT